MELEEFKKIIKEYGENINLKFNDKQIKKYYDYMNLLIEWNEKINLTAITEPKEIILKHFIDSLTINKYIKENSSIVDVGTGAGFPGIVLGIYREDIKITLVDSLNKRIKFLDEVIKVLDLKNIKTIHSRVEDFGQNNEYREKYDYSTARAVAKLSILAEYLIPLVKIGGYVVVMKGNDISEEIEESKKAIQILGGKIDKIESFNLPKSDNERNIILINKKEKTKSKYPRKAGMPKKEPII